MLKKFNVVASILIAVALAWDAGKLAMAKEGDDKIPVPGKEGMSKSSASERALRRAYDGAPPVIPHRPFGMSCMSCHTERGMGVPVLGFAPPSPHTKTPGMSGSSRCQQCHAYVQTQDLFSKNLFQGLAQDLRRGGRLHAYAPPTIPHAVFMREDCLACHAGPAAREEIRCHHPERSRCLQCHVPG